MCKWETIINAAERRGNFTRDEREEAEYWEKNPTGAAQIERHRHGEPVSQKWRKMAIRFIELVDDEIPDFDEIRAYLSKIKKSIEASR